MSKGLKFGLVGGGVIAIILVIGFVMSISYQNRYEALQQDIDAQYKKIESDYDKMARIIAGQAGVVKKYSSDFKEIYKGMMTGRYGEDGSKAMWQWIKEQNPQIDASMYNKLMVTIEAQRTTFSRHQEKVASMVAESNKMLKVAPASWFVDGEFQEANIVSSSATKAVMQTGIDDSEADPFADDK